MMWALDSKQGRDKCESMATLQTWVVLLTQVVFVQVILGLDRPWTVTYGTAALIANHVFYTRVLLAGLPYGKHFTYYLLRDVAVGVLGLGVLIPLML